MLFLYKNSTMNKSKFKDNLRKERSKFDLTQEEFAKNCGLSRNVISQWENGFRDRQLNELILVCKYYNIDPSELLGLNL